MKTNLILLGLALGGAAQLGCEDLVPSARQGADGLATDAAVSADGASGGAGGEGNAGGAGGAGNAGGAGGGAGGDGGEGGAGNAGGAGGGAGGEGGAGNAGGEGGAGNAGGEGGAGNAGGDGGAGGEGNTGGGAGGAGGEGNTGGGAGGAGGAGNAAGDGGGGAGGEGAIGGDGGGGAGGEGAIGGDGGGGDGGGIGGTGGEGAIGGDGGGGDGGGTGGAGGEGAIGGDGGGGDGGGTGGAGGEGAVGGDGGAGGDVGGAGGEGAVGGDGGAGGGVAGAGGEGGDPGPFEHPIHSGWISALVVQQAGAPVCLDRTGDGRPNNAFGGIQFLANPQLAEGIADGRLRIVISSLGIEAPGLDGRFDLAMFNTDLDGAVHVVRPENLNAEGQPRVRFSGGRVVDGEATAGPATYQLTLLVNGQQLTVRVTDTFLDADMQISDEGLALTNGHLNGLVSQADFNAGLAVLSQDVRNLVPLFVQPDVDTDGDGRRDTYSVCMGFTTQPVALRGYPVD